MDCPICATSLELLNERQREEHCDKCLDTCAVLQVKCEKVEQIEQIEQIEPKPATKRTSSASSPKPKRVMPFYKVLSFDSTKFAVDAFSFGKIDSVSAYFLTHFHSDHYGGLSKNWAHGKIYCSESTARLLIMKLNIDNELIIPLELNKEYIIENVKVRLLDANHCPGAVVVLFDNKVLHTGDFRANKQLVSELNALNVNLQTLYLDTTYLDPGRKFPNQPQVNKVCSELCVKLQQRQGRYDFFTKKNMNRRIMVMVGTYTIGKERIAVSIAKALKTKIWVNSYKRFILEAVNDPEILSFLGTSEDECQVTLCPMGDITLPKLKAKWASLHKTYTDLIGFAPTGWTWSRNSTAEFTLETLLNKNAYSANEDGSVRVYRVPYSEHSSYAELEEFCAKIPCSNIVATVPTKNYDILRKWQK